MMRYKLFMLVTAAGVGGLIGLGLRSVVYRVPTARPAASEPVEAPALGDLDVRALKAATFASSPLEVAQALGAHDGVATSVVAYTSEGRRIYGRETVPTSAAPRSGYPTIILCHGYSNPSTYQTTGPEYRADMEALTRHGYAVIKPDYRGQGRSPGVAEGAYYSDAYVIDVLSLVTAIKQTEHLDHAGMGIAGHSMGGYIALKAAVVSPDIKAAVVLAGAVGDAQELYAWEPVSVRTSAVAEELKERVTALHGTPTDNPQYWANTSPLTFLRDLHGPVQVHVGSADAQVPAVFSAELQHKLAAAGAVSSYFEYPGGDHSLAAERGLIWPRVVELFDGALGVSTARTSQVPRLPPALQRP